MSEHLIKIYEIPTRHLTLATSWLHGNNNSYFTKFGFSHCYIQLNGTSEDLAVFEAFLGNLFVTVNTAIFPKRERKFVEAELYTYEIEYSVLKNPFAFEIKSVSDERKFDSFLNAVRIKRNQRKLASKMARGLKKIPKDASSLMSD